MTLFFVIFMASVAAFNYRATRTISYPPLFFAVLWMMLLLGILFSGDFFYPVSEVTMALFSLGVFMFSLGGLFVYAIYQKKPHSRRSPDQRDTSYTNRFFDISLVILILSFPFYWRHLQQLGSTLDIEDFWIGLRVQTSSGDKNEAGFGIFAYLAAFSTFISLAAYYENNGELNQRLRAYALILVSLTYHMLTASRLGAIITIFGLIGVALVRNRRINIKSLIIGIVIFFLIFSVPAILLGKGGSQEADFSENAVSLTDSLRVYALGGLVAMDGVVIDTDSVESNWRSLRFFTAISNKLGSDYDLPSSNLEYTLTPHPTNVYTIYFPYFQDYGWVGTALIMFILGSLATWVYMLAIDGDPQAAVIYALIFANLMLSSASEPFMTSISYWIQALLLTFVLYKLPGYLGWNRQGLSSRDNRVVQSG